VAFMGNVISDDAAQAQDRQLSTLMY
jgi:hypothetical protein